MSGRNLFTLFIAAVFIGALVIAWDWPLRASIIVLVLGVCGAGLALAQFVVDLRKGKAEADQPRPAYETPDFEAEDPRLGTRNTWETWAWLVGLVALIPVLGMPVALTAFVFLYCKTHGGGWLISLFLASLVAVFIWGVYVQIMHVYWPNSLLGDLLSGWMEI
jgi:hypothetical protein